MIAALVTAPDLLQRVQPLEHEVDAGREQRGRRLRLHAGGVRELDEPLHLARVLQHVLGAHDVRELQRAAEIEPFDHLPRLEMRQVAVGHVRDGGANQLAPDHLGALQLALVFHLELARDRRQRCVDVGDARDRAVLAVDERAALGIRDDVLHRRDGQALADARALVDAAILPRLERDLLDDFRDEGRHVRFRAVVVAREPRLLRGDRHRVAAAGGVVRANLGADAVLQRRDDLAARRVVLRVRRERHHHVERQAHRVSLNLDVAFLQDVEQADLDLSGEVGQLVDGEDAPVGTRDEAEVDGLRVAERASLRHLDRVDVADQVADARVGGGELLAVPVAGVPPGDRRLVAFGRKPRAARAADRIERVVVDLAARHGRDVLVEQRDERAQQARLRLAAQAEQDEVVLRQQRVDELRHDGVVVADDPGEERFAGAELGDQVLAHFLVHVAAAHGAVGYGPSQVANGRNPCGSGHG